MYDLPSENPEEPGLPDEFHNFQAEAMAIEEREKKEKLAARLRSLGINPDDI